MLTGFSPTLFRVHFHFRRFRLIFDSFRCHCLTPLIAAAAAAFLMIIIADRHTIRYAIFFGCQAVFERHAAADISLPGSSFAADADIAAITLSPIRHDAYFSPRQPFWHYAMPYAPRRFIFAAFFVFEAGYAIAFDAAMPFRRLLTISRCHYLLIFLFFSSAALRAMRVIMPCRFRHIFIFADVT